MFFRSVPSVKVSTKIVRFALANAHTYTQKKKKKHIVTFGTGRKTLIEEKRWHFSEIALKKKKKKSPHFHSRCFAPRKKPEEAKGEKKKWNDRRCCALLAMSCTIQWCTECTQRQRGEKCKDKNRKKKCFKNRKKKREKSDDNKKKTQKRRLGQRRKEVAKR